jgi:hypothetical protein
VTRLQRANILMDGADREHTCHLIPAMRPICPSLYSWMEFDFSGIAYPHAVAASLALDGYPVRARRKKSRWCTGLLLNCSLPNGHRGDHKPWPERRHKGRDRNR